MAITTGAKRFLRRTDALGMLIPAALMVDGILLLFLGRVGTRSGGAPEADELHPVLAPDVARPFAVEDLASFRDIGNWLAAGPLLGDDPGRP